MVDTDISLHDVAEALHVHYMTAYRYVREGILPGRKVGRSWSVRKSDLDKFQQGEGLGAVAKMASAHRRRGASVLRLA